MRFPLLILALLSLPFLDSRAARVSVDFAFRDASSLHESERRNVGLQGPRDGSFRFDSTCGHVAENCECLFFRSPSDTDPLRSSSIGISAANNSLSCMIPGSAATPDQISQVAVRLRRTSEILVDRTSIKTALVLDDLLGKALDKNRVRGIFRYSCSRTFFEGEGVSANEIACVPGQHLGVLHAFYNFYTFRSHFDGNFPGGDSAFPSDICKRNSFLNIQCTGSTPELRYGFYSEAKEPFVVGINMTRAPEGENRTENYGFAALPDSAGRCPVGLVKARPWIAQPQSQLPTGPNCPTQGCPSSFINADGALNNTVVEMEQPMNFLLHRQPNTSACDMTGDCTSASFGGTELVQSVTYSALTPVVCVIPPALLNGIF